MKKSPKDHQTQPAPQTPPADQPAPQTQPNQPDSQSQIASLTADLQRTRADFENFRKQTEMQRDNAVKSARLQTVFKLLPLLDDFSRAISTYAELAPLGKSLVKAEQDLGLSTIDSSEGTEFNPDLHDAAMVEGEGDYEVVSETLRPGYYYEGEVLRPAMVKVKRVETP